MPKFTKEITAAIILLGILCICYYGFIPEGMRMMVHSALVLVFGVVAILLWYEKPADEREQHHSMISAQAAFTAAGLVLVIAIVHSGLTEGHIDPVAYWTFGAMLIGKVGGRLWAQKYR